MQSKSFNPSSACMNDPYLPTTENRPNIYPPMLFHSLHPRVNHSQRDSAIYILGSICTRIVCVNSEWPKDSERATIKQATWNKRDTRWEFLDILMCFWEVFRGLGCQDRILPKPSLWSMPQRISQPRRETCKLLDLDALQLTKPNSRQHCTPVFNRCSKRLSNDSLVSLFLVDASAAHVGWL